MSLKEEHRNLNRFAVVFVSMMLREVGMIGEGGEKC
jgi:hypothetical protein